MGFERLPPWIANTYFDPPQETTFTLVGGTARQVAEGNPRRVALMFSNPGSAAVSLSMNPNLSLGNGFTLVSNNVYPFILTHADFAIMVVQPWYAISAAAASVSVWEVVINVWPDVEAELGGEIDENERQSLRAGRRSNGRANTPLYRGENGPRLFDPTSDPYDYPKFPRGGGDRAGDYLAKWDAALRRLRERYWRRDSQ